jgi:hypothetical protein
MVSLIDIAAEFRGSIGTSIRQIRKLLKDNNSYVRGTAAAALSKLSEQGMLHIASGMISDKHYSRVPGVYWDIHSSDCRPAQGQLYLRSCKGCCGIIEALGAM